MTADPRHDYLAAYRRSVESPAGVRDDNLQAVLKRAGNIDAAAAQPRRWAASALVLKITTVALVTTGLGWGAVAISRDAPAPKPEVAASTIPSASPTDPAATEPPAASPQPVPAVGLVPTPPRLQVPAEPAAEVRPEPRARVTSAKTDSRGASDQLREELALLGQAQRHLRDGETSKANAALREHARRFPQGTLAVERAAWRAIAACAETGPQPKAAARSFVLTYEDTPLSAKVKAECEL